MPLRGQARKGWPSECPAAVPCQAGPGPQAHGVVTNNMMERFDPPPHVVFLNCYNTVFLFIAYLFKNNVSGSFYMTALYFSSFFRYVCNRSGYVSFRILRVKKVHIYDQI